MEDKEKYLISKLASKHIGDDGAVVGNAIYSADAFCEDTHFRRSWMSPYQVGRKAMLVNISDAVAMNAEPRYALVTISLPQDYREIEIDELLEGLETTAKEWGCEIIGGDTVKGDKLNISITLVSQSDNPLPRTGIEEGDLLAFTGILGESKRDLTILEAGESIANDSRFFEPVLRSEFISKARPYLRAGMDISDGLFCDTNKLLEANKYGLEILENIEEEIGLSGEEYEMLVAVEPIFVNMIEKIASMTNTNITFFAKATHNTEYYTCQDHHNG